MRFTCVVQTEKDAVHRRFPEHIPGTSFARLRRRSDPARASSPEAWLHEHLRGEAGPDSDIDLLVLLSPPLDYFTELRQLVDLLYPIQLESERLISAKPVLANDFELGSLSLYRNARREGVAV